MATHSDTLRNAKADAVDTAFGGGTATLKLYTGAGPGAGAAATGTELVSMTLPNPPFGAAAAGVISKSGTWSGTAIADGTAGYSRITNGTNVLEGTVGTGAEELVLDSVTIVTGGTVTVSTFTYTVPTT